MRIEDLSIQKQRIEEASLNSWPAHQQILFDGWLLRSSKGYTKRANSITPLYPSFLPVEEKIPYCENLYWTQNQPSIFRLPSFLPTTSILDQTLANQQYQYLDQTLVLTRELSSLSPQIALSLNTLSRSAWLELFCQFNPLAPLQQQLHSELLERILISRPVFAFLQLQGIPVACGLGVLEGSLFGLFDILVNPSERNKGYGTQLIANMLAWSVQHNARYAYLQVVATNYPARRLYDKLGFTELYSYWYRVKSAS